MGREKDFLPDSFQPRPESSAGRPLPCPAVRRTHGAQVGSGRQHTYRKAILQAEGWGLGSRDDCRQRPSPCQLCHHSHHFMFAKGRDLTPPSHKTALGKTLGSPHQGSAARPVLVSPLKWIHVSAPPASMPLPSWTCLAQLSPPRAVWSQIVCSHRRQDTVTPLLAVGRWAGRQEAESKRGRCRDTEQAKVRRGHSEKCREKPKLQAIWDFLQQHQVTGQDGSLRTPAPSLPVLPGPNTRPPHCLSPPPHTPSMREDCPSSPGSSCKLHPFCPSGNVVLKSQGNKTT